MRKGFRAIWGGVFFAFLWRGWGGRFEKRPYLWVRPYFVVRLVI